VLVAEAIGLGRAGPWQGSSRPWQGSSSPCHGSSCSWLSVRSAGLKPTLL
jgi:hypothetical protein